MEPLKYHKFVFHLPVPIKAQKVFSNGSGSSVTKIRKTKTKWVKDTMATSPLNLTTVEEMSFKCNKKNKSTKYGVGTQIQIHSNLYLQ